MDSWVVSQISFWYTMNKIKPKAVVDKIIEIVLDLTTPNREAGETSWWMRGLRSIETTAERTNKEIDIRRQLRQWDNEFPEIHHELIIRWLSGAIVSVVITSIYRGLTTRNNNNSRYDNNHRRY